MSLASFSLDAPTETRLAVRDWCLWWAAACLAVGALLLAVEHVVFLAAVYQDQRSVRIDFEFGLLALGEMALLVALGMTSSAFLAADAARAKRLAGAGYLAAAGYAAIALANGPVLTMPYFPSVGSWLYGCVALSSLARGAAILIAARAFSRSAVGPGVLGRKQRDGQLAVASAVFALSALLGLIGWAIYAASASRADITLTVLGEGGELLAGIGAAVAFLVSSLGAASDESRRQRAQLLTVAGRALVVAFLLLMLSEFIVAPHANLSAASTAERWLGTGAYAANMLGASFATVGLTVARGRRVLAAEPAEHHPAIASG